LDQPTNAGVDRRRGGSLNSNQRCLILVDRFRAPPPARPAAPPAPPGPATPVAPPIPIMPPQPPSPVAPAIPIVPAVPSCEARSRPGPDLALPAPQSG
jgi:hypothetical protein